MLDDDFITKVDGEVEKYLLIHNVHFIERKGKKWFRCVYPEHNDSNPSMTKIPTKNVLKCFGCGKTLNITQAFDIFHPSDKNLMYADKIQAIAEELGLEVPNNKFNSTEYIQQMRSAYNDFESFTIRGKSKMKNNVYKYLEDKNIPLSCNDIGYIDDYKAYEMYMRNKYSKEILDHLSLLGKFRFSEDSLLFLLRDENGNIVASASRYCGNDKDVPKYINASNSTLYNKSKVLFGMHNVKQVDTVILVEGYSDATVAQSNGLRNTLALCGTQLSSYHMAWIKSNVRKGVVLALDGDDAGQQGMITIAQKYFMDAESKLQIAFAVLPDGKDPDDVIISKGVPAMFANIIDRIMITESILKIKGVGILERDKFIAKIIMNSEKKTAIRYINTYAKLRNITYDNAVAHITHEIRGMLSAQKDEYIQMATHWSQLASEIDRQINEYVNLNYWNSKIGGDEIAKKYARSR